MTRLNGRMIQEIRIGLLDTERRLQDTIGMGLQSLAFKAADLRPDSDVSKPRHPWYRSPVGKVSPQGSLIP